MTQPIWPQITNVTDRQTDGQLTIAIPRFAYGLRAVKTEKLMVSLLSVTWPKRKLTKKETKHKKSVSVRLKVDREVGPNANLIDFNLRHASHIPITVIWYCRYWRERQNNCWNCDIYFHSLNYTVSTPRYGRCNRCRNSCCNQWVMRLCECALIDCSDRVFVYHESKGFLKLN